MDQARPSRIQQLHIWIRTRTNHPISMHACRSVHGVRAGLSLDGNSGVRGALCADYIDLEDLHNSHGMLGLTTHPTHPWECGVPDAIRPWGHKSCDVMRGVY